jgi:restriction endonuclease
MTPSDYEQYVTNIVRLFDFCKQATISNNRKFQGKRQPGEYEIDIAVEVNFSEAIYFLMIVECKYWNRPVDRPVIQSLAQTKDAISAHKAIVASLNGFSEEAEAVAVAHNIGLWWIDPDEMEHSESWRSVQYEREQPPPIYVVYNELHSQFIAAIGLNDTNKRDFYRMHIDDFIGNVYHRVTTYVDWRNIEKLRPLVQWEYSSIQKLKSFNPSKFENASEQLTRDVLTAIASDDFIRFQYLAKCETIVTTDNK